MEIATEVAKNEIQSLVNLVKKEACYLCCFNSYAQEFEQKKGRLNATLKDVSRTIDKARGVSHVTSAALQWKREAEELVDVVVDAKKDKCFNDLCLNWWHQYRRGKALAKRTLDIDILLDRCNFDIVDGPTDLPGIKYHCLPNFMHFESRKSTFEELQKTLEDEENNKIGLYGLGGTGKTSMATEVGAKLEGTTFDKIIFLVVSKPPDFKKLRGEIAKNLDLKLEEGKEEVHKDHILTKINVLKEKLLIVLDDVWEEFDLTEQLGIPPHHLHKGCRVLITTRIKDICTKMDCQRKIHLDTLNHKEALSLFLQHTNNSSNLESLAQSIVEHCHGVPVVIVAVARSLKDRPLKFWKESLRNLQSGKPILKVRDDLKKVYEGLKLSYDNLKNEKAKRLFLISSLFPEDFEIPIEILITIGVGMGPFGEVNDYNERRQKILDAIWELQVSSLLLNAEAECVKMHDMVHEIALLIGENDIQSVLDSEVLVKNGLQCLFWKNNDFPKHLDGGNLEILIILLNRKRRFNLNVTDTLFSDMTKLKVLFLQSEGYLGIPAPSLFQSIQSLQDLRTLSLRGFELSCISKLEKLLNLETLWLGRCSIIKLPDENFELEKLRFLRIQKCTIKMSNPFKLIEACPKLEELTFFNNQYDEGEEVTMSQKVSFHAPEIYQISSDDLSVYFEQYGSLLSRCFEPGKLMDLISEATFKKLARTAELLILEGSEEDEQKNLIPHIVSVGDKGMTDLIYLELCYWPNMQCLIDSMNHCFDANAFSNLVELRLHDMGLSNMLFNGNYNLCHLKTMEVEDCPKLRSIFLPFTAQSLSHLKKLIIKRCDALECIIEEKSSRGAIAGDDGDNHQKSYDTLFLKLETLRIASCGNLEMILPILPSGGLIERITIQMCEKLKYIFDKFQELNVIPSSYVEMELSDLPSLVGIFSEYKKSISLSLQHPSIALRGNLKETLPSTKKCSFSWAKVCCFKSRATSEEDNDAVSTSRLLDEGIPQDVEASKNGVPPSLAAQSLLVQPLKKVRKVDLWKCGNLISISTQTLATSIISLEHLTIRECHKLKYITTHEGDAEVDKNKCSIFSTLEKVEIKDCKELEILFRSTISLCLQKLKILTIEEVPKLKYVVGNYQKEQHSANQNQIYELHFNLPALEELKVGGAPMVNGICSKNYKMELSSLNVVIENCGIKSSTEFNMMDLRATEKFDTSTDRGAPSLVSQSLLLQLLKSVRKISLVECHNLISLSTLSIAASTISLEVLTIRRCHKLKYITTHEGHAEVDKNNCSIFPTLEKLEIKGCEELEIIFGSTISICLQKLKILTIEEVPKLKYVVGNYQKEHHSANQNQIYELHFNLPSLEDLKVGGAPMVNGICSKNYKMELSSLNVVIENCGIKSFTDYNTLDLTATEKFDTSIARGSPSLAAQSLLLQMFKKVRKLDLWKCGNLISLSIQSLAASIISLEHLTICECHKLKYITTHEGYAQVDKSNTSIFPTLEKLEIKGCEELEILFVSTISICLQKLKILTIEEVPKLKYVVGNYEKETLNNIFAKNYSMVNWIAAELEVLVIKACGQLKCIVADEGDDRTHKNYNSIFPKLRVLKVSNCNALEYLFPEYAFTSPENLESLKIFGAPMLKYVFGRSQHDDSLSHENMNIQTFIDFPTLKDLTITNVPNLVSIYPENYYMRGLSLLSVILSTLPEFTMGLFKEFLVCWHTKQHDTKVIEMCWKTLESLEVCDFKTEEIFDLKYMETEKKGDELQPLTSSLKRLELKNLSELVNICVGPKCIIRFDNLHYLSIRSCKKLRVIFSASTVRSLPMLVYLNISKCEELVYMVEDYETNADAPCFPNLQQVIVRDCDKLKYLFSITISDILPKLTVLEINKSYELEHVLIRRGEMKEMLMKKHVLPQLIKVTLEKLPNLISICHGIDFQILKDDNRVCVRHCPNFSFYETSQVVEKAKEKLSSHISIKQSLNMGEETQQSRFKEIQGATGDIAEDDVMSEMAKTKISSSDSKLKGQLKVPIRTSHPNLALSTGDNTQASAKISVVKEEEEDALVTSQRTRSGMKAGSSLPKKKLETSMDESTTAPNVSKNQDSEVWEGTEQKLSSHLNGRQASKTQQPTTGSSNFTRGTKEDAKEIVEEGVIFEKPKNDEEVNPSVINTTDSQKAPSKDDLMGEEVRKETIITESQTQQETIGHNIQSHEGEEEEREGQIQTTNQLTYSQLRKARETTPFVTISEEESSKIVEVRAEEGPSFETLHPSSLTFEKEHIPVTPTIMPKSPSTATKIFQVEEKGDPFVPPKPIFSSEQQANYDTILPLSPKHGPISTSSKSTIGQFACGSLNMTPSVYDTTDTLRAAKVQEIVNMMKLEGDEASMLIEAIKTNPQLCLSSEYQSTELLCFSYRVLLNILNILATKTPFTITEAEKGLLAKHLNDAFVLGFDKSWLQSIRIRVFNYDVSEVQRMRQVLKDLGNKLDRKKIELAILHDQEEKAAQSTEMAQKELEAAQLHFNIAQQEQANVKARHCQLLQECKEILEQRDQCWEIIAAKFRHFGF